MSEGTSNDATHQTSTQATPAPLSPPPFNVELKKTKIIWAQPAGSAPLTWTETMMDLVKFRTMLDERVAEEPLSEIPTEHIPLIAKLVQESDKDLKTLTSEIHNSLSPDPVQSTSTNSAEKDKDGGLLPLKVVEAAVKRVANRVNYGIDGGLQGFCVWRWELEELDHIPNRMRQTMLQRRNDRQMGQAVLLSLYQALPEADKKSMLTKAKQKKQDTGVGGKENIPETAAAEPMAVDTPSATAIPPPTKPDSEVAKPSKTKAKDKEKEPKPKKTAAGNTKAKDTVAPIPSAKGSLLGWFAPKAKAGESSSTAKPPSKPESPTTETVEKKPAFDEIFLPFRAKKSTTVAPINYFKQRREVIILDGEDEGDIKTEYVSSIKGRSPLAAMKASTSKPSTTRYTRLHASAPVLKTVNKLSVRDLIEQLNDATTAGDVSSAKALISTLSDRKKLPLRWLHFWENTRPMYIGTWSKTSPVVGPRTPFAKEEGVNYDYDSGEEWLEEEEGEEMEDLETLDGEEEEEEEEENNDWIVDDDEEELEQDDEGDLVLALDDGGDGVIALPSQKKRKAEGTGGFYAFNRNKRRKLVTLKPSCQGPHWETVLGEPQIPAWSQYSIRVLNDTPLFIDPLVNYSEIAAQATAKEKDASGFVIPAIPDRLLPSGSTDPTTSSGPAKKRGSGQSNASGAKPILPDHLVQKMAGLVLEAPSGTTQVLLVDKVHQALKAEGAKKNAVEATLKQVFEKEKTKKRWVVKEEYRSVVEGV